MKFTELFRFAGITLAAAFAIIGLNMAEAADTAVKLSGDQEVPSVATTATGISTIVVNSDKSVSGSVKTVGLAGTMAHIHVAEPGKNGPPIIALTKTDDNTWSVPAGAMLTDDQYKSFKEGNLYVNVHSAEHKGGEIRSQLKP